MHPRPSRRFLLDAVISWCCHHHCTVLFGSLLRFQNVNSFSNIRNPDNHIKIFNCGKTKNGCYYIIEDYWWKFFTLMTSFYQYSAVLKVEVAKFPLTIQLQFLKSHSDFRQNWWFLVFERIFDVDGMLSMWIVFCFVNNSCGFKSFQSLRRWTRRGPWMFHLKNAFVEINIFLIDGIF